MCPPLEDSSSRLTHPRRAQRIFSGRARSAAATWLIESIAAALEQREISLVPPDPHLAEPRGVFTTLYYRGDLRGCVGYVFPVMSLYRTVAESARGAAFDDSRFRSGNPRTGCGTAKSLSASCRRLQPIRPEEVEIGRHGLLISLGAYRGLLLPQVPVEHGWDRITFLEQTCRKAGLPPNAWQTGAKVEAFTAEVFGDGEYANVER